MAITLLMTACMNSQPVTSAADAAGIIQQYYQAQQAGQLEQAAALFAPESRQRWLAFLQDAEQQRGTVQQFVIEAVEPNTVYSGKFYLAIVRVTGSKAEATESVTLFDKLDQAETYLVSHKLKIYNKPGD